jgi:hypothetical protein
MAETLSSQCSLSRGKTALKAKATLLTEGRKGWLDVESRFQFSYTGLTTKKLLFLSLRGKSGPI